MYKAKKLLFSLVCLSGVALTVSCSATNSDNISENQPASSTTNVAQVNPGAANTQSIGGPLAAEIQDKPVLVDVFATWCSACKNIAPTLSQLKQDYDGQVHFVILDVSDKSTTAEAEAKAKQLGLSPFLAANKSQTGLLTIIDPKTGNILAQHRNNPNIKDYTTVIDAALSQ